MRCRRIHIAALSPRKLGRQSESCGTSCTGKKPHVYRVIYEIEEARQTVWVLHICHSARRKIKSSDLE
jgi:hypothetical protein